MRRSLLLTLALIAVVPVAIEAQQTIDLSELIAEGRPAPMFGEGLYLDPRTLEPYTGPVVELHESRETVKTRGTLKDGKWDGPYLEYYEDGSLKRDFTLQDGVRHGLYAYYYNDGIPVSKGMLHMGVMCGEWTEFNFGRDHGDEQTRTVTYRPC